MKKLIKIEVEITKTDVFTKEFKNKYDAYFWVSREMPDYQIKSVDGEEIFAIDEGTGIPIFIDDEYKTDGEHYSLNKIPEEAKEFIN